MQRLVFLLGVHVNGLGLAFGGGMTGVPLADAAWSAGEAVDAAAAGAAVAPTASSSATAARAARATPRLIRFPSGPSTAPWRGAYRGLAGSALTLQPLETAG